MKLFEILFGLLVGMALLFTYKLGYDKGRNSVEFKYSFRGEVNYIDVRHSLVAEMPYDIEHGENKKGEYYTLKTDTLKIELSK